MLRREFLLLLSDTFNADKHDVAGTYMSTKLDGQRAFWDGGASRNDRTIDVPWSSIHDPKTGELKSKIRPFATGLWSRYGNPIAAPEWFLDGLPEGVFRDGELYIGPGKFQETMSATKTDVPIDARWSAVQFHVFGAPTPAQVFLSGLIKNPNMVREINYPVCAEYLRSRGHRIDFHTPCFKDELDALRWSGDSGIVQVVEQTLVTSIGQVFAECRKVTAAGGEGVMLRSAESFWYPKRRPFLLKVKPRHDSEATITGFVAARAGVSGQLLGKLGCLQVEWHGDPTAPCGSLEQAVNFEVGTGLTHADRDLFGAGSAEARLAPGKVLNSKSTPTFRVGDKVTFSYMGVSTSNIPREPAFLRKFES